VRGGEADPAIAGPLLQLGGHGPPLHFACANGFPPEVYLDTLARLCEGFRVVSLPPRALWPGIGPPPRTSGTWEGVGADLAHGLATHGLAPVLGVGHSFGAVATLLAAARAPHLFRGLVLLDPTISEPAVMTRLAMLRAGGEDFRSSLVQGALKRRVHFGTPDEAFAYWREKELFRDWSDRTLGQYVDATLMPPAEGDGWTLRWSPQWEAWYYRSYHTDTWAALGRIPAELPALVVRGATSDTFLPAAENHFRSVRPATSFVEVEGYGHLFPMAVPEATAAIVQQWATEIRI